MNDIWNSIISQASRTRHPVKSASASDLLAKLFGFRIKAHLLHLATDSFAEHKALGGLYEAIDGFIDSFSEVAMGAKRSKEMATGVPGSIEVPDVSDSNALLDLMEEFLRKDIPAEVGEEETALLNMRDDLLGTVQKTRYLLTLS
jgi:hypothetical protein